MNQAESRKRLLILVISYIGQLFMLGGYIIVYFAYYYPVIIKHDTKLYFRGHLLIFSFIWQCCFIFENLWCIENRLFKAPGSFWVAGICFIVYECVFLFTDGYDTWLADSSHAADSDFIRTGGVCCLLYMAGQQDLPEAFPSQTASADLWGQAH